MPRKAQSTPEQEEKKEDKPKKVYHFTGKCSSR